MDSRLCLPPNMVLDGAYRIKRVVGSGGFGITYEAEDIKLQALVAIKEYYPLDFGDRSSAMSVRPKSERHKPTFDWGLASFQEEARTLARFEHPSIVRVSRVFESNSTAYMVMRFERGQSLESFLRSLGRSPTQEELDRIAAPLLEALELLHSENFLHRDIAPDNIIVRPDGTPVLLDFGTARRAVAEKSRVLTGIVKAGYSPQEQYATDSRLQGPWSDIYAFGGTLYRAVVGKPPEEATLRIMEDRLPSAQSAAKGSYRPQFLAAIDRCLEVTIQRRPQSIAELRPMLLGFTPAVASRPRVAAPVTVAPAPPAPPPRAAPRQASAPVPAPKVSVRRLQVPARLPMIAAIVAVMAGAVGGIVYTQLAGDGSGRPEAEARQDVASAEDQGRRDAEARREAEEAGKREEAKGQAERDYQEANRYLAGREVTQDFTKARELFERAASAGHTGGMVGTGWLFQTGRGAPRDFARAHEWYEKAAAQGNTSGMYHLGWLYRDGLGVTKDYARAREWYEKSANGGHSPAMLAVAGLHQNGWGVPKDYGRAREWFEKAAAKGNSSGMFNLGVLHQLGRGVPQDYAKAREWYERSALAGNAVGMSNLGWLLRDGQGGPRDYAKAREWFEKSAAAGSGLGMNGLGVLYQNGEGVTKDFAKAREWYEKATAIGESYAMNNLGRLYQSGSGVPQDYVKAREWYGKSAAAGNRAGMGNLASLLDQGKGGPPDHARAASLLLDAAKGNNSFIVQSLRGDMKSWTNKTRTELKRELNRRGHYNGPIDDLWNDAARSAVDALLAPPR